MINRQQLITKLISRKLNLTESVFLVEDRLPTLYDKFGKMKKLVSGDLQQSGSHSIPSLAKLIVDKKPIPTYERHTLDTLHDSQMDSIVTSKLGTTNVDPKSHAKVVLDEIAEHADPTDNKQYTERIAKWYSQASDSHDVFYHPPVAEKQSMYRKEAESHYANDFSPEKSAKIEALHKKMMDLHDQRRRDFMTKEEQEHSSLQQNLLKREDFGRVKEALNIYDKVKHILPNPAHKDINNVNSLRHLEKIVQPYREFKTGGEIKKEGSDKLYEDDDIAVYHIKTPEASCAYGAGTRWCISSDSSSGAFREYDKTSPIIAVMDKRKKFLPNLKETSTNSGIGYEEKQRRGYFKYMMEFGENRGGVHLKNRYYDENHPANENISGVKPHEYTEHQFMDESDEAVNPDTFDKVFGGKLSKIPALQHLHVRLFQNEKPEVRKKRVASGDLPVSEIMDHFKKFPSLHRIDKSSEYNSQHEYLVGLMDGHESRDHPIMAHFFGSSRESPKVDQQTSADFFRSLQKIYKRKHGDVLGPKHPFSNLINKHVFRQLKSNPHLGGILSSRAISDIARDSHDPEIHEEHYKDLTSRGVKHSEEYSFLRHTPHVEIIRDAWAKVKEGKIGNPNDVSDENHKQSKPSIQSHLSMNKHTPDDILHEMAFGTKLHQKSSVTNIEDEVMTRSAKNSIHRLLDRARGERNG